MSGDKKDNIALMFLGGLPNGENFKLYKLWFASNSENIVPKKIANNAPTIVVHKINN